MDKIVIEDLKVYAYHGVFDFEKEQGQNFYVSATLYLSFQKAGLTDDLNDSVSYADVCTLLSKNLSEKRYNLIETAAEQLCLAVLNTYPQVKKIDLTLKKPEAPIKEKPACVSVQVSRAKHIVYLGVGSNMGDTKHYIESAIHLLDASPYCKVLRTSKLIASKPYGGVEQDDFLNGVIEMETTLEPEMLLSFLHDVEASQKRTREVHWGPRTLDLDILFYDDLVMQSRELTIPHPDLEQRDFVLVPLAELAPMYRHPVLGKTVTSLKNDLTKEYVYE